MDTSIDDIKLVNMIVYLASLVSDRKAIDPMLDTLRIITASWDRIRPLSNEKRAELLTLSTNLKEYLIHSDPLRKFTNEQLDEKVAVELSNQSTKFPPFIVFFLGCLSLSLIALLLPISMINREYMAVTLVLLGLIVTNIWFYLSALHHFRPELRPAFRLLCTGAAMIGLTCLHYNLIDLFGVTDNPLFRYGGATEIAMFGFLILYLGMKKYATVLQISTSRLNKQLMTLVAISLVVTIGISIVRGGSDKFFFGLSLFSMFVTCLGAYFGGQVAKLILTAITKTYTRSLWIFYLFQWFVTVTALCFIVALIVLGSLSVGTLSLLIGSSAVPSIALFMYSGYSFKKEATR